LPPVQEPSNRQGVDILAKAKRVFQIARELGVESKAILEKCRAEGVDLNNHMSTIKLGLEMTIVEWFSSDTEESPHNAVETAEKVDLTKVKAKARKRKKLEPAPAEAVAVVEAPAPPAEEEPAVEAEPVVETPSEAEPVAEVEAVEETASAEPVAEIEGEAVVGEADAQAEEALAAEEGEPAKATKKPKKKKKEDPQAPPPVMNAPVAAKLKGPRVVRIEAPESVPLPRQRRAGGPGGPGGSGGGRPAGPGAPRRGQSDVPQAPQPGDIVRSTGPVRGKGIKSTGKEEDAGRSPRRQGKRGVGGRRNQNQAEFWTKGVRREQDLIEREARLNHASGFLKQRKMRMRQRAETGAAALTPMETGETVQITEPIFIKDLSSVTGLKGANIIKFLFNKGVMATINATIDAEAAMEVCLEYGIDLEVTEAKSAEDEIESAIKERERTDVKSRPPVVAVLGHVDHGKTSLLDKIRSASVASGEAGGITQHIGAFRTSITGSDGSKKTVVFLDTPGHEAFTNMRLRGANMADLVVLVVAADDGLMPQTIESINHAKASETNIVVALNKIDKPEATDANITKILGQLAEHELNPVEWGGTTEVIRVSAETGEGVNDLIEILDYQAEVMELTADYDGHGYGQVVEAQLTPGMGPVARVLVQEGEVGVGDFVVVGHAFGKVRSMKDDLGKQVKKVGPATPVEISGIDIVPEAGDKMYVTSTLKQAEEIANHRREAERREEQAAHAKVTLDNVFDQMKTSEIKELRVVLKADVQGSIEVLKKTLSDLNSEEVRVNVLHSAVGGITESDVLLAEASDAVIIGFQVIANAKARAEAERRGVDIRLYRVIYDITDDITNALEGMLAPIRREEVIGHAEVREVFRVSKVGAIAGCYVTDGMIKRNALIRVTRNDIVIEHDRVLDQLKRFKDDAKEVKSGLECGCKIQGYDDIHEGDILECYVSTEEKAKLAPKSSD
jgi:translation initiation factor IF-2